MVAELNQAGANFDFERTAHSQILPHGWFDARFLVRPAAINDLAGGALEVLELPPPVLGLAPSGQRVAGGAIAFDQVHALAARVPEQVQVGREMHVGLQHVAVHLEFKRRAGRAGFFCEHLASRRRNGRIDLLEQFVVQQGDVVPQGLMTENFGVLTPRRGRHAQHLPHERIVVGNVFQPIPVRIQSQPHDAQDENLPEVHAGATGGLFASDDFSFQQGEDLGLECWVHPDPLQTGQDGRQLVAALERQPNLFDGGDLQIGLGLEMMAHGGEQPRMLQVQTQKTLQ